MKKGNVVIWHIGRCGSTVLSSILNQHPKIQSLKEFLNPIMQAKSLGKEIPDIETTFQELKNYNPSKIQILEVKFLEAQHLSVYNISLPDLINRFIEIGYDKFIILERKNYLNRMISHCVGQETRIFHLKEGEKPRLHSITMDVNKISVGKDKKSLIDWFKDFEGSYGRLRSYLSDSIFLELQFEEDIQSNVIQAYEKVCLFLNVETYNSEVPFARTNPFDKRDILINFKEVEKVLKETKYSWMLEF